MCQVFSGGRRTKSIVAITHTSTRSRATTEDNKSEREETKMWRRLKRVTFYAGVGGAVAAGGLLLYASSPLTGVSASTQLTGPRKTTIIPDFPAPATTVPTRFVAPPTFPIRFYFI
jgi:hypothetical protein